MTRTAIRRAAMWLNPGVVVLALAVAAVLGVGYARTVQHVRDGLAAPATASPPATAAPAATYSIAGKVRLQPGEYTADATGCRGTTLAPDVQVIVSDRAGAALTQAPLGAGRVTDGRCDLPFTLAVPAGAGTYGLDVPGWGQTTYTEQQLADLLDLTFG